MNKKSLIIAILLVFVVILSSSSVFAEDVTDNTGLQQNDDSADIVQADEVPTPKTETVAAGSDSSTIQDKINSLNDGDTLNFTAGEYNDISIYVNKSITINGNGAILKGYDTPSKDNTPEIIWKSTPEGGYGIGKHATLFIVNTNNVVLNGITFIGGTNSGKDITNTLVYAYNVSNIDVENNTFDGSCTGLYLELCHDGTVYNNTVKNQASTGILNFQSARTLIKENKVTNAINHGIDVRHGVGPNVKVINNTVIGSKEGIYLMHSPGHIATENTIINCTISSITCYGSKNIRIYNNKLQYSRIGILLANDYENITIEENNYQLYRLPMPPIFTYYVAEAKSDYQGEDEIMGAYTDISRDGVFYSTYSDIPTITPKTIDYDALLKVTGVIKDVPDGVTSAEIQSIIDTLKDGDGLRFAENGKYYDVSIFIEKNIKVIGNNATLYGLQSPDIKLHPEKMVNSTANNGYAIIYSAIIYTVNNTNAAISNLNIVSRYPDHKLYLAGTPTPAYKTAGIYGFKSANILITNCTVDGASFGIMLHFNSEPNAMIGKGGCENAIVTNNKVTNQFTYGILNFGSKASYIANNTVVNARWHGIDVRHQMGPNVVVYNNTIIGSSEGIYLMHSHGHKVYENTIKSCSVSSITAYGSINDKVNNDYIFNNTLQGSRIGILVGGGNQNVTIGKNTYILDNQKSGDKPGFELYIVFSEDTYSDPLDVPGVYNDQKAMDLEANDTTVDYNKGTYTIKLTDSEGKALANRTGYITINNQKTEIKTDDNGVASVPITLNPGTYDVETLMVSDYYYASAYKLAKITVNKIATALTAPAKTVYLQTIIKGTNYQVTLKADGKGLAGKEVTINYNGKTLTSKTNANGVATFKITAKATGSKQATITFKGDDTYKPATAKATIKVTKEASKMAGKKKVAFKANAKVKKYVVTLKSKSNAAIKKALVTLKINGKLYKAYTNNKGVAILKIVKFTKKGNFRAVAQYKGNNYYTGATLKPLIVVR